MRAIRAFRQIPEKSSLPGVLWRSLANPRDTKQPLSRHLDAAYRWLCRAQDCSGDSGVSAWYDIKKGWVRSYPETTGYIIPSLLCYAALAVDDEARQRALRMADWEVEIQMSTGAVLSGQVGGEVVPAVFNTGQVISGWIAAYLETGSSKYADAARRAADWLVKIQDGDGAWRRHLSGYTSTGVQAYNVRAAWCLGQAGAVLGEPAWVMAARANCDWVLSQQDETGWYANNTFKPEEAPLLHTISYVLEGLCGVGRLTGDERYLDSAHRAADALIASLAGLGRLHGCYHSGWKPAVPWRCLTGDAQLAGILLRFVRYEGIGDGYRAVAEEIIRSLCALQEMNPERPAAFGAIPGSHPVWGAYLKYRYPNWATKFHLDALLLLVHDVDPHALGGAYAPSAVREVEAL